MRIIIIRMQNVNNPNAFTPASVSHDTPSQASSGDSSHAVRSVSSEELFAGDSQLIVRHRGRDYCLRITNSKKLILTA